METTNEGLLYVDNCLLSFYKAKIPDKSSTASPHPHHGHASALHA
jgi:hypothetical protein